MVKITSDLIGKNVIALRNFSGPLHYDEDADPDYVEKGSVGTIKAVDSDETIWVYFPNAGYPDRNIYWVFGDLEEDFSPT